MIQSTKNYEMFTFTTNNRESISPSHVLRLKKSIEMRNLLEMRPIIVDKDMNIIDGQHRLCAAKELGVTIYYQVEQKIEPLDIIKLNVAKNWSMNDYFNFWVKEGKPEYIKLKSFMSLHGLSLAVALNISGQAKKQLLNNFREGVYTFEINEGSESLDLCWETVGLIRRYQSNATFVVNSGFWRAMLKLFRHAEFDASKWRQNMQIKCDHFGIRARYSEYLNMLCAIYNWKNQNKISFNPEEIKE